MMGLQEENCISENRVMWGINSASFSSTTEVTLLQRQQQQQQYSNNHYESSENNQTELHRFGQNADRFTTSGGTNITTVRSDFLKSF